MATTESAVPQGWDDVDSSSGEPEATDVQAGESPHHETPETSQLTADGSEPQATTTEAEHTDQTSGESVPSQTPVAPQQQPQQPQESKPFAFAVDGIQVAVPGAIETADGWIVVPRNAWNSHVVTRLANRESWKRERTELQRELAIARDPARNPEVQQAKLLIEEIDKLKEAGPEGVVDWALQFLEQAPVMEANARAAAFEARSKRYEDQQTEAQEQQLIEHYAQEIPKNLQSEIDELLKLPELVPLGLSREHLYDVLWDMRHSIYFEAPEDMPEAGLRKGDVGVRRDLIRKHVGRQAQIVMQHRQNAATVASAKQQNAQAVATGSNAPPAVGTRTSPAAPNGKKPVKPNNYDEWVEGLYS